MESNKSFWADSVTVSSRKSLTEKKETDVVIIGGGFTGLSTAYHLQQHGVNSIVLEQHHVGWGASGRNAGMLTTGYKKGLQQLERKFGQTKTKILLELSVECINLVKQLVEKHQMDCDLENSSQVKLAYKPSHFEKLQRENERLNTKYDYHTEIITPEKMKEEINTTYYHGGLLDPYSAAFNPFKYCVELARVVEELGGLIYEDSKVIRIKRNRNSVTVITPKGEVKAKELVIATNGYSTNITKKLTKSIMPIDSHIITTEPLPNNIIENINPKNRVFVDTKNFLYYFRLTKDNRMLFGGRVSFKKLKDKANGKLSPIYETLRQNMIEVHPELENVGITHCWGGTTAFTMDFLPHIGRLEDGTYFGIGYCGHGAAMSTLFGKFIADDIFMKYRNKSILESIKLKRIPLHSQRAKILSIVSAYYKIKDMLS